MVKVLLAFLFALCLPTLAQSQSGHGRSEVRFLVTATVMPSMKITSITPVQGGTEYRGFTNMKTVTLDGTQVTVPQLGAFTVVLPTQANSTRFQDGVSYEVVIVPSSN